tara:strand:- start:122 stop:328 length:207 start_codon:yes stop_codon:yes gene_type:complete
MDNVTQEEKKGLSQKFREFQLSGLKSYGKYLDEQVRISQTNIRKSYLAYIEKEIIRNNQKIKEVESKL